MRERFPSKPQAAHVATSDLFPSHCYRPHETPTASSRRGYAAIAAHEILMRINV